MIPRNLSGDSGSGGSSSPWQELEFGAATISAFAELCKRSLIEPPPSEIGLDELPDEAKAILIAGGQRGVVDIRACKDDFDSVERFLAVCVESEPDSHLLFLRREDPVQTVAFLEGFADLCRSGLIIHHLGRDFSFSKSGYKLASSLVQQSAAEKLAPLLDFASKLDR